MVLIISVSGHKTATVLTVGYSACRLDRSFTSRIPLSLFHKTLANAHHTISIFFLIHYILKKIQRISAATTPAIQSKRAAKTSASFLIFFFGGHLRTQVWSSSPVNTHRSLGRRCRHARSGRPTRRCCAGDRRACDSPVLRHARRPRVQDFLGGRPCVRTKTGGNGKLKEKERETMTG